MPEKAFSVCIKDSVFIDPHYNTGHDFVNNDKYSVSPDEWDEMSGELDEYGNRLVQNTESNGRFIPDWLNMIYPRMKIAKYMLTYYSFIFTSIDDELEDELENIIKICEEVFGKENHVGTITRATGTTTGQDANKIGSSLDYCVVYSKSPLLHLTV